MGWHRALGRVPRAQGAFQWTHKTGRHLKTCSKRVAPFTTLRGSGAACEARRMTAVAFEVVVARETNAAASKIMYLRPPGRLGLRRGAHLEHELANGRGHWLRRPPGGLRTY